MTIAAASAALWALRLAHDSRITSVQLVDIEHSAILHHSGLYSYAFEVQKILDF